MKIRQRLLENQDLTLSAAYEKARSLELAQKNADFYNAGYLQQTVPESTSNAAEFSSIKERIESNPKTSSQEGNGDYLAASGAERCMYCGNRRHFRKFCPARNITCFKCLKKGHFAKVCQSKNAAATSSVIMGLSSETISDTHSRVNIPISVYGISVFALVDTGSTLSHISDKLIRKLGLQLRKAANIYCVGLAEHDKNLKKFL